MSNYFYSAGRWLANYFTQGSGDQLSAPLSIPYEGSNPASASADVALQVSTVWACVDLLSKTISSMPVIIYDTSSGARIVQSDTILWQLLHEAPNRRHSPAEFWRIMCTNYFLRGNAYARIGRIGGRNATLFPLMADAVTVTELENGALEYEHTRDGIKKTYSEREILHIRGPGNGVTGMSRLDFMRQTVGDSINATNHSSRTFRNKGRRQGLLFIDRILSKQQREAVEKNFGDMLSGDKTLSVIESDFRYEGVGLSPADMQLLEARRFSVEEICRWFGVPSVLVNDTGKTTVWGSGVSQIIEGFSKFTVRPELTIFEQALKRALVPRDQRASTEIKFSMDELLRASRSDRMEIHAKAVQNGIYSRNRARELEDEPPSTDEGADLLTAQSNLVPLGKLGEQAQQGTLDADNEIAPPIEQ